eukprot:TRINITY_DN2708_c0_g1_i1.p1 TRINITY_DN2708_c0_g1~~TRINITY_DN2708_c0_g1_i1.p1  ORF type:complete len:189 (-),score=20.12 TRINITY_DN2708_c0_g1_i1:25-591(-)
MRDHQRLRRSKRFPVFSQCNEGVNGTSSPHTTCPNGTTICSKTVRGLGYWNSDYADAEECGKLVEYYPECSSLIQYGNPSLPISSSRKGCRCYLKEPACCGTCAARSVGNTTNLIIFEVASSTSAADPTCSTGVAATDGTNACCSGTCAQCRNSTGYTGSAGFCCSTCIPAYRTCDLYGPPCTMIPTP